MKRTILLFVIVLLAHSLIWAQSKNLSALVEKYQDNKKFTSVEIDPGAIKVNPGDNEDNMKAVEIWSNVSKIHILKIGHEDNTGSKFYESVIKAIEKDEFSEMIKVMEDKNDVGIYVLQGEEGINEFVVAVKNEEEYVLIQIIGDISYEHMSELLDDLDVNFENE